jgi:uncharacterized protein YbjQ (UPF0145 family)
MTVMSESSPATFPVTTALGLEGMTVERDLGLTFGLVVRSMGFAKSFGAGLTALRQGEVPQYTELLEDSRRHAIDRMIDNARLLGANAVIAMRFDSPDRDCHVHGSVGDLHFGPAARDGQRLPFVELDLLPRVLRP